MARLIVFDEYAVTWSQMISSMKEGDYIFTVFMGAPFFYTLREVGAPLRTALVRVEVDDLPDDVKAELTLLIMTRKEPIWPRIHGVMQDEAGRIVDKVFTPNSLLSYLRQGSKRRWHQLV